MQNCNLTINRESMRGRYISETIFLLRKLLELCVGVFGGGG